MYQKVRNKHRRLAFMLAATLLILQLSVPLAFSASDNVKLVIDGQRIDASPQPFIQNGRTLVPFRVISEELAADIRWDGEARTVHIAKGNRSVLLRIDSRLVEYNLGGEKIFGLTDTAPQIFGGRTFVPIRLVSNALGVGVDWDNTNRTVLVDSTEKAEITPFYTMEITSITAGHIITGTTELKVDFPDTVPAGAAEIKYLLINPETGRGRVVARGNNLTAAHHWLPDLKERGERVLVAALYDGQGQFLAGDAMLVQMAVTPQLSLGGVAGGQKIKDTVSLKANLNFMPAYVKYEIVHLDKDKVTHTGEMDPLGAYSWTPEESGRYSLQVTAYSHGGQAYPSQRVSVEAAVERRLGLKGVSAGTTIAKPVTLLADRNFPVSETEYVLRDPQTGTEEILATIPYGSYRWFPGPGQGGSKEVLVRVKDPAGKVYSSAGIKVKVTDKPLLLVEGIGPKQVVTGPVQLKVSSNVKLQELKYILTQSRSGAKRVLLPEAGPQNECPWVPVSGDDGDWLLQAEALSNMGTKVISEEIPFRVYLGEIYSAKPIIAKDEFLDLAKGLATQSWQKTGMSAALQTAQAILETGWGQSVPVDKYTGRLSNNLFGIKGTGPAGSVTSNTWEEYNGQTFYIDANFRAYNSVAESWADHKEFLFTGSRYEPFRAVMHDSAQGAWALKRAGYATDSQYALKLMDIIDRYDLKKLDEVGI